MVGFNGRRRSAELDEVLFTIILLIGLLCVSLPQVGDTSLALLRMEIRLVNLSLTYLAEPALLVLQLLVLVQSLSIVPHSAPAKIGFKHIHDDGFVHVHSERFVYVILDL